MNRIKGFLRTMDSGVPYQPTCVKSNVHISLAPEGI